jgi:hypothetical protein
MLKTLALEKLASMVIIRIEQLFYTAFCIWAKNYHWNANWHCTFQFSALNCAEQTPSYKK